MTAALSGCGLGRKASVVAALGVVTVLVIVCLQLELSQSTSKSVLFRLMPREKTVVGEHSVPQGFTGDSNLPYPSHVIENIQDPPPNSVFKEPPRVANDTHLKKILFWNDDYVNKHFEFGFGREPFLLGGCRVNTCVTTGDRNRYPIEEVDAVIWHLRSHDRSLPKKRSPHTRYVFWFLESPSYMFGNLRNYHNVFNWTFTYRMDSDIPQPYNRVFRRRKALPPTNRNYAAGKTKLAAWFVSHCGTDSGRDRVVEQLQKRLSVDVYGKCGKLKCPMNKRNKCFEMLNKNYKFYLSFENSLCRDYVTEKFFKMMSLDVVPVVYGSANYSALAPPHSYIDALSFPSVNELADYLLYLHHNDTAYNEYFRWKRFHQMFGRWTLVSQQYCDLCEKLHTDTTTKIYDMQKWYVGGAQCKNQNSADIKRFIYG